MIHNRLDLQQIQDPHRVIGDDEPVFLLRSKCPIAVRVAAYWCDLAEQMGWPPSEVASGRRWVQMMQEWHEEHGRHGPPVKPHRMRV